MNPEYEAIFNRQADKKWLALQSEKNIFAKKNKWQQFLLQKGFEPSLIKTWSFPEETSRTREQNNHNMNNLRISLIQTSLHWEDKTANLDMLQKKIETIPDKPELIILPEMFSTGFSMDKESLAETMDGPTVEWMKKTAARKRSHHYRQYNRPGGPEPV